MKIAVTGGAGFIGRHVVPVLAEDHSVVICDISEPSTELTTHDSVIFRECDVTQQTDVTAAFGDIDAVFHKVGLKGGISSLKQPHTYYDVNVGGTLNVIEACRRTDVKTVVYDSTESIYGTTNKEVPFVEETIPSPSSLYGATKHIAEVYLQQADEIDVTVLRYPRIVSPTGSNAITTFYEMITGDDNIILYGDGTNEFDFVHIEDVVRFHRYLLDAGLPSGVFHVAADDAIRLVDLVERIGDAIGVTPQYECVPREMLDEDLIEDDLLAHVNTLSNNKSKQSIGFNYRFPNVQRVLEDILNQIHGDGH